MGGLLSPAAIAALELVDDGVIVVSTEGGERVVFVNAAFERASKIAREQALGRSIESLLHPRPIAQEEDLVAMTRADGEEYVVRRKRAALDPAITEGAEGPLFVEIHRDVTAERALRRSEERYRMLAERSTDLISRADSTARVIYISQSCRDILGFEPDELVGTHAMLNLAHPDDVEQQRQVRARFIDKGITSGSPLRRRIRRKDGKYVWLEVFTNIERDANGNVLEVQSWARDISARVVAEQALQQSEASFRSLLDGLPDGAAVHRNGIIVYANAELVRMLGHARAEDLVGRPLLEFVHAGERDSIKTLLRDEHRTGVRGRERRISRPDGTERVLEITSLPIMFEGAVAFLAVCHDVTERKSMEGRLAQAERMALVGRLASGVGHEINNPVAYMLVSLELARGDLARLSARAPDGESVTRLDQHLVRLREGAERVRDIVRDLKSLSAVGEDRLGPVDVEHTLDVAAATAQHEIRLRARLVKEYGSVAPAWGNEGRLAQVFVNLLVNAAQAIPEGHAADNEIRIGTREDGELIVVEVRDTGTGIAAEDLPHIFEPFFTTKQGSLGTGLGLSISHNIVTAQNGTLAAERSSPRGTLFRVTLRKSSEPLATSERPAPAPKEGLPARVLVVDDEPMVLRVFADLLSRHDVTLAHGGREAIGILAQAAFDVVVCDVQMKDGTGAEVYDYLCAHSPDLARRTIFTTGGAFTRGARDFLARCPQPVLEKPFDEARFVSLVGEMATRAVSG